MNTVTVVAHPETGKIITPSSNNPDWGTVRVDSESVEFTNGILNKRNRTAFIRGEIKNLAGVFTRAGQIMQGKIVKHTSKTPFYKGQNPVMNPTTSEVVMRDGAPFYQNYEFTTDLSATDNEVLAETRDVASKTTAPAEKIS